jgi:hypothetical protein
MLNLYSDESIVGSSAVARPPVLNLIGICSITGLAAAVQLFVQISQGSFGYSFTGGWRPAGPFEHRNTAGPVLALFFMLALVGVYLANRARCKVAAAGLLFSALVLLTASYMTTSRNGILMLALFPWLLLFIRPNANRLLAALFLPVLCFGLVLWIPLPHSNPNSEAGMNRLLQSIECVRSSDFENLSGGRVALFRTAINISRDFPAMGAGVGTFPLLAQEGSNYRAKGIIDAYGAAHSIPLNLLAESGGFVALAWLAAWVILPWAMLIRAPRSGPLTVILLVAGLANIVDTMWMISGITTFSILLVLLSCCESTSGLE